MILEQYFQKRKELKTANAWKKAMAAREVQRNSYHNSGDLKQAKAFAQAVMMELEHPMQNMDIHDEPQTVGEGTVIFSRDMLPRPALALV
jgi:hypothetical protein